MVYLKRLDIVSITRAETLRSSWIVIVAQENVAVLLFFNVC